MVHGLFSNEPLIKTPMDFCGSLRAGDYLMLLLTNSPYFKWWLVLVLVIVPHTKADHAATSV